MMHSAKPEILVQPLGSEHRARSAMKQSIAIRGLPYWTQPHALPMHHRRQRVWSRPNDDSLAAQADVRLPAASKIATVLQPPPPVRTIFQRQSCSCAELPAETPVSNAGLGSGGVKCEYCGGLGRLPATRNYKGMISLSSPSATCSSSPAPSLSMSFPNQFSASSAELTS